MNQLQQRALARTALSEAAVSALYDGCKPDEGGRLLKTLCESHERLRAELHGMEILMAEALALCDTGTPEFKKAFPPPSASDAWFPRESVPGWRVVESIREALGGG